MAAQTLAEFQSQARDPARWQRTARELAIAANYLIDWYDTGPREMEDASIGLDGHTLPMMVLYAAAAENLLKAIMVARGHDPVPNGTLHRGFLHHDLQKYASTAVLALDMDQAALLRQLSDLMASGKYPVARVAGQNPTAWQLEYPADVERIWSLLEYLETSLLGLHQACLPRWSFRTRYRPVGYSDRDR